MTTQELLASKPVLIYYLVMLVVLVGMFIFIGWFLKWYWPRTTKRMHYVARDVARSRWYVHGVESHDKGSWLLLVSDTIPRQELNLFFRYSHPDLAQIKGLQRMDLIGFAATGQAIETELGFELPSHLRLKR